MTSTDPSLAGYLAWVRAYMGVPTDALPDDSPAIALTYDFAFEKVNPGIVAFGSSAYTLAVYNLGGSLLIQFAPDVPPSTYFADLRKQFKVNEFVAGVVSSSSDSGTSVSISVAKGLENLTISDLARLKDPYGRAYLGIAQDWGTNWGVT